MSYNNAASASPRFHAQPHAGGSTPPQQPQQRSMTSSGVSRDTNFLSPDHATAIQTTLQQIERQMTINVKHMSGHSQAPATMAMLWRVRGGRPSDALFLCWLGVRVTVTIPCIPLIPPIKLAASITP
jgi:hypothetical protein